MENLNGALIVVFHFPQQLPFSCVPPEFTRGISRAGNGVIALSIAPTSLATELSANLNLPHKLALCLSSSSSSSGHGDFCVGGGPYFRPPIKQDLSESLLVTQLLIDPVSPPPSHGSVSPSEQYYVDVTAIKVNLAPVNFNASLLTIDRNGRDGTKISTLAPYKVLRSDIYRALVAEFSRQAAVKKIRRAENDRTVRGVLRCEERKELGGRARSAGGRAGAPKRRAVEVRRGQFDGKGERGGDVPGVRGWRVEAEDGVRDRGAPDGGQSGGVRRGFDDVRVQQLAPASQHQLLPFLRLRMDVASYLC